MAPAGLVPFLRIIGLVLFALFPATRALDARLSELEQLVPNQKDGILRIDDGLFEQYVRGSEPRPYGIVLFFDAMKLHSNHELKLQKFRREYALVARAHLENNLLAEDGSSSDTPKIFFCDIEFNQAEQTFSKLSISTLPSVRYFAPSSRSLKAEEMDFARFTQTAEGVKDFVRMASHVDVGPIERPPPFTSTQLIILAVLLVVAAPFVIRFLLTTRTPLHNPWFWCTFGLSIYFFSVSGGMFNIIRGMPMYVPDHQKPGHFVYFYGSSGAQFGVEGFTLGSLYTVVGLLLAFATHLAPKIRNSWAQRGALIVAMLVSVAAVQQVVHLDHVKTGYWIHGFWPAWLRK